jgi:hypothetical protein
MGSMQSNVRDKFVQARAEEFLDRLREQLGREPIKCRADGLLGWQRQKNLRSYPAHHIERFRFRWQDG